MPGTTIDTALARRLHAERLLDLPTLEACLNEVRSQRGVDPDASLAVLLVERRLLPGERLDPIVRALVAEIEAGPRAAAPGQAVIGAYRVIRPLAAGGMGAVYEAEHTATGARYALKTIHSELALDREVAERFRLEAQLNARLDHPHVVRIHEAHLEADPPYLVQDLLPGGSLQERIADGPLPLDDALTVAVQLGQALKHAHGRDVIHRDLKPLNVLLDDRGQPRLTDFGLARSLRGTSLRLTVTGTLLGTPNYMPPEQALGKKEVGPAADVYALGGILYACLTGSPPFPGGRMYEVLDAVLHRSHIPLRDARPDLERNVSEALDRLLARVLAKEPEDRPGLDELLETLTRIRHGDARAAWRGNNLIALATTILLALAAALSLVAYRLHVERRAVAAREALAEARAVEADLFGRWLLGLSDAARPDPEQVEAAARSLESALDDLHDPNAARAILGRVRAAARLLSDDPQPASRSTPTEQLVDAVLHARRGLRAEARPRLERVLAELRPIAQRPAWLLNVQLADIPRLQALATQLPAECTAARDLTIRRLEGALRARAAALVEDRNPGRIKEVEQLGAALTAATGDQGRARSAKRAGLDAAAEAWARRIRRPPGRAWLDDCLHARPASAVGRRLLTVAQAELEAQLAKYEKHRNDPRAGAWRQLAAALELDHLLSYAHGSTWKTSSVLAEAVVFRIVRRGAITDPRIRTMAVGAALRGAVVVQPAFRLLLQRSDAAAVARVLARSPRSQAFRFLKLGPRDRAVPRAQQVAWVRGLLRVLADPGRDEIAPVWRPELRFQAALAMTQIQGFPAAELEEVTRRAYESPLLDPIRIEAITHMRAGALGSLGRFAEIWPVMRAGVQRLQAAIAASPQLHDRLQRTLLTLHRGYALMLASHREHQRALEILAKSEALVAGLRLRRPRDRWWLDAARAHVLRGMGKTEAAWKALAFERLTAQQIDQAMESHNLCAQEMILLTQSREGDDAARALLRRVSRKRMDESDVLRELRDKLDSR